MSCPHRPEQNGVSKRKHRHIVEIGLTLLAEAAVASSYWVEAFNAYVYFINRLPTKLLNYVSPYVMLFHRTPNYSVLRVFGCSCFPYLRPYNKNKLEFRSKYCAFLGYSLNHQGYRCLSRHIIFNESIFLFQFLSKHSIITQPMESTSPTPLYPLTTTPIPQTTSVSPLPTQPISDQPLHEVSSSPTDQSNSN